VAIGGVAEGVVVDHDVAALDELVPAVQEGEVLAGQGADVDVVAAFAEPAILVPVFVAGAAVVA